MEQKQEENKKASKYYDLTIYERPEGQLNLFARSGNRRHEVIIGGEDNGWDTYCEGYRRAAEALVFHLTQADLSVRRDYSRFWESTSYTVLFLYRHYLELRIKRIFIAYGGDFVIINNKHSLSEIWELLIEKHEEFNKKYGIRSEDISEDSLKDIQTAKDIITQFNEIDEKSQIFRYPVDKKGRITLAPMQLDIVRIKEMMGWTSQFLDGWSVGICEYEQAELRRRYEKK